MRFGEGFMLLSLELVLFLEQVVIYNQQMVKTADLI